MLQLYLDCDKKKEVLVETLLASQPEENNQDESMTLMNVVKSRIDPDKNFGEESKSEDGGLGDLVGFEDEREEQREIEKQIRLMRKIEKAHKKNEEK